MARADTIEQLLRQSPHIGRVAGSRRYAPEARAVET